MKIIAFVIFSLAIVSVSTFGSKTAHTSKPIILSHENLTRLKNSPVAKGVKKGFKSLASTRLKCPECAEPFQHAFQYTELYKKPFLIVEMEPMDFGGYFVLIVFRHHPKVYRFWLYEIDEGEFQLREIVPLEITLNKRLMDELNRNVYTPYWLKVLDF